MSILKYKDPKTGEFKRINPYKADLSFVGKDGITIDKAADSEKMEISGSGCVQKDTTPARVIYAHSPDGSPLMLYPQTENELNEWWLPVYRPSVSGDTVIGNAVLLTAIPTRDYQCANKKYVDNNYVKKVKFTNLEQALNGYILDTTKEAYADLDSAVLKDSVAVGDNVYPIADKTRALVTRIEGKTTKMVQLLKNGDFSQGTDNWVKYSEAVNNISIEVVDNSLEVTALTGGENGDAYLLQQTDMQTSVVGRKYLILVTAKIMQGEGITGFNYEGYAPLTPLVKIDNTNLYYAFITATTAYNWYGLKPNGTKAVGDKWSFSNCQCFDLTAMNREDITTVEQFKAEFPELYPYENGNIYPAKISGVKFTGKNLLRLELSSTNKCNANIEGDVLKITPTTSNAEDIVFAEVKTHLKAGEYVLSSIGENQNTTPTQFIVSKGQYGENNITTLSPKGTKFTLDSESDIYILIYPCLHAELPFKATSVQIQIQAGSHATAYEPYTEPVSVTLPETYNMHGIGDYKDYLEITKNEGNELYTLKKVQNIGSVDLGTLYWQKTSVFYVNEIDFIKSSSYGLCKEFLCIPYDKVEDYNRDFLETRKDKNLYFRFSKESSYKDMTADEFKAAMNGVMLYYALATPVETVIVTKLTYEQVTAIRHNGGLIEVEGNVNKGYARPTIKNTVVYRLTATNTAAEG